MQGKFVIQINLSNSAFGETAEEAAVEIQRILRRSIDSLEDGQARFPLKDINGNTVGTAGFETED